jgi:imidazolonepropionase-like amidohydrolase
MSSLFLRNARVLDIEAGVLRDPSNVRIEGGVILDVDAGEPAADVPVLDLAGKTLMPGLIDAHVHVMVSEVDIGRLRELPATLAAVRAGPILSGMLDRGFTTVRDTAGADFGLREGVASGLLRGPRLFICGRAISQTGGHVDYRLPTDHGPAACGCCSGLELTARIADGVPAMLHAVRDELRRGADHIKLTVSGGVASPSDPLDSLQFTPDEIRAAVQAATDWGAYVCAHAYSTAAIRRALDCGVRSIEHGNMIDEPTARLAAEKRAFVVPTLVTYESLQRYGEALGMSAASREKNDRVLQAGLSSLEACRAAGVEIGFGTDLLGALHVHQSREFLIRSEAMSALEILRSATLVNARLLRQEGRLGVVAPGAIADLIVVDGDPLNDIGILGGGSDNILLVVQAGRVAKDRLQG